MSIEVVGMIGTKDESRAADSTVHVSTATEVSPDYIARFSNVHEQAGFDTVLIGYRSTTADGFAVAGYAAQHTSRLRFLIAHRPGVAQPTLTARQAATLDQLTGGRIALHIITGGSDPEQRRDGDFESHDARYARTAEYMDVLHRLWTRDAPVDYEGQFYRFVGAFSHVKPLQQPHIPLYFGGASEPAVAVGARHADVYALWGEPLAAVRQRITAIRAAAKKHGRVPRIQVSFRPIIGDTEDSAWERARTVLDRVTGGSTRPAPRVDELGSEGSRRLVHYALQSDVHDGRLYMPIAAATSGAGNTTALVGTAEQVADSLLAYYDLGVRHFLLRGFDPMADAEEFGRSLIPLLREGAEARDRGAQRAHTGTGTRS